MKEIYYKKDCFGDGLETEMFCDGEIVDVNKVKEVKIKFPNDEVEYVSFKPIDRYISDRDIGYRDIDFIFNFKYKGITFVESARGLIYKGCSIFIEMK